MTPPQGEHFPTIELDRAIAAMQGGAPEKSAPPQMIGPYRIIGVLGAGGMGIVYEAEQQNPRRRVALKMIHQAFASDAALRRFMREPEILARLEHPGIARIYEAGAIKSDGLTRPYFAMELVRGVDIKTYAKTNKLGLTARLELLAKVADAVDFAHDNGVVHRDLKPANILVDEDGQPRILDFGVARLTEGDKPAMTMQTTTGQIVGTLSYMSPEQTSEDSAAVDRRSDVYALGVVAYEVLAEKLPYELSGKSLPEMVRIIRESEPARLSSISRSLRGDVETILAKALEKEKARRYATAAEFAADIRRHLTHEPIAARPASTWYQLRKFARRNRILVGSVAAVILALVIGIIGTTIQSFRARRAEYAATTQRARADEQANAALRQVADLHVRDGFAQLEAGEPAQAVAAFVRSLRINEVELPDPIRARADRIRVAQALSRTPRPIGRPTTLPESRHVQKGRIITWFHQADGTMRVCIWDPQAGREVAFLEQSRDVRAIRFNPDATRAAVATGKRVTVYDTANGKSVLTLPELPQDVFHVDISADDTRIAVGAQDALHVFDAKSGAPLGQPVRTRRGLGSIRFSPDSRMVAVGVNDRHVRLVDREGQWITDLRHSDQGQVIGVYFSPDSRELVTVTEPDHQVHVWDLASRKLRAGPMRHESEVTRVVHSDDSTRLLTLTRLARVRTWDASSGQMIGPCLRTPDLGAYDITDRGDTLMLSHVLPAGPVQADSDKWRLLRASEYDPRRTPPVEHVLRHLNEVWCARFTPDGSKIITAGVDHTVRIWDAKTGLPTTTPMWHAVWEHSTNYSPFVNRIELSPDGQRLVVAARLVIMIYDARTGRLLRRYKPDAADSPRVSFHKDGQIVAISGLPETRVVFWNINTGGMSEPALTTDRPIDDAVFSPDGALIACDMGDQFRVYDAQSRQPLGKPIAVTAAWQTATRLVSRIIWSPDSRLLAVSRDRGVITLVDARTGIDAVQIAVTSPDQRPCCFSRDGRRLATGFAHYATIYDTNTGKPVSRPLEHQATVEHVAFSADGQFVVTAGIDRTARVWDLATSLAVTPPLEHGSLVTDANFSPDGRRLVTSTSQFSAQTWKIEPEMHDLPTLELLVELLTANQITDDGTNRPISGFDWLARREEMARQLPEFFARKTPATLPAEPSATFMESVPHVMRSDYMAGDLAWRAVYNGHPGEAIVWAKRGIELKAGTWCNLHLAQAYTMIGQFELARPIYLEFKDTGFQKDFRNMTFGEAALEELEELERRGIRHPDFAKVRALLKPAQ